ncbi:MAG: hypothetical protein Tsb009_17190 [Planctomycetaceae bacterium]
MVVDFSTIFLLAQAANTADTEPSLFSPWMVFLFVFLLLGVPFLLGNLIAKALKLKDLAFKISIVLLAAELGLTPMLSQYVIGALEQRRYEEQLADWQAHEEARKKISESDLAELKQAIPNVEIIEHEEADNEGD